MAGLLRKVNFFSTLFTGGIAGVAFCIPLFFYIRSVHPDAWLLYLGCFLFFTVIWIHAITCSSRRSHKESMADLIVSSHVATFNGIAVACILSFILLCTMVPAYLAGIFPDQILTGEPSRPVMNKTEGVSSRVFLAAGFINFCMGSFASIVVPFALKASQKKGQEDPAAFHQQGTS